MNQPAYPGDRTNLRARCSDPTTPPEVLAQMVDYPWEWCISREALALNPAMPLDALLTLAEEYPNLVLANPSLRLHLAVDPDCLKRTWAYTQVALVSCLSVDPAIIRLLATNRSAPVTVRVAAAANPRCPEDLMWAYLRHARQVRMAMLENPGVPRALAEEIERLERARVDRKNANLYGQPSLEWSPTSRWSRRWRARSEHRHRRSQCP